MDLKLTDREFWALTLRDYEALLVRWQEGEARQDRRAQQIVWILAEINRDRKSHPAPYTLDDFTLHDWGLLETMSRSAGTMQGDAEQAAWAQINRLWAGAARAFGPDAAVIHNGMSSEVGGAH